MSEEVLKVEKSRTGTGSGVWAEVNVFSNVLTQPGEVTVAKTSSTGYEGLVLVGGSTAFVADSSQSGYQWKAKFEVWVDYFGGWPVGTVSPVVVLSVYTAEGFFIGTVEVTLAATGAYMVAPASITFSSQGYL
jgi:hypothetical protein